jgi:predicted regulator of Ras-like GTPase activity (Roadblock/LC7/MglB family)
MDTTTAPQTTAPVERREYRVHKVNEPGKKACEAVLRELQEHIWDLRSAGVVGPDGFEISWISTGPIVVSKLAALTSTLVAVGQAFMQESGIKTFRDVILDTEDGCALLLSVPVENATYGLFVVTGKHTLLGNILLWARICAGQVQEALVKARQES